MAALPGRRRTRPLHLIAIVAMLVATGSLFVHTAGAASAAPKIEGKANPAQHKAGTTRQASAAVRLHPAPAHERPQHASGSFNPKPHGGAAGGVNTKPHGVAASGVNPEAHGVAAGQRRSATAFHPVTTAPIPPPQPAPAPPPAVAPPPTTPAPLLAAASAFFAPGTAFGARPVHPKAAAPPHPSVPVTTPTTPRNGLGEPMIAAGGPWPGPSLKSAGGLVLPIAVGLAVAVFILVQALIDRRDPKVSAAPQRSREDTVGFD